MTKIEDDVVDTSGLEAVVEGARALDTRLDELTRARIAAGLGRELDARAVERARRDTGGGRAASVATALRWLLPAAGVAAIAWVALGGAPRVSTIARGGGAVTAPSSTLGRFDRLEVPAGTRARARLGRADLTVVGPAQLEVTRVAASDVTMRLSQGTLVGDYDGSAGGRLRIETPHLVADIVGTRFVIEATAAHARVSVAHGRVAVRDAGTPEGAPGIFVSAGQSWEVGRPQAAAQIPAPVMPLLLSNDAPAPDVDAQPARPTRPTASPALPAAIEAPAAAQTEAKPETPQPPAADVPATPLAVAPSAAELYRRAEEAMSKRDGAGARRWLEEIVARHPSDVAAESARFELARDAMATGAPTRATRWLDELIAQGHDRSLVESARFLKCRIAREGGEPAEARRCLERFRGEHPRSVRDQEALAALVSLAEARGACDEARGLRAEHRRLYPDVAEAEHARCPP